jgi:muconate cycloisomerase
LLCGPNAYCTVFGTKVMPDSRPLVPADLQRDLAIVSIRSTIVDVPTVRRHKLSSLSVTAQCYVIVELRLANGVEGVGEAATLGGPRWSEESVESIKATIDAYLAPALIGASAERFEAARIRMDEAAKRNNAAKAAIESALFDAVGKTLGVPAVQLLGGAVRESMPVLWTLASGDPAQEIEEAEKKLAARLHDTFKVKIGAQSPEADVVRLRSLAGALAGRGSLIVDANQAWDETTALRYLPALAEFGVGLMEQPLPAWNLAGMARLRARSTVPLMSAYSRHTTCWTSHAPARPMSSRSSSSSMVGCSPRAMSRRWPRRLGSASAGELDWRSGAFAGLRRAARARLGLRAFRPADPRGRFG